MGTEMVAGGYDDVPAASVPLPSNCGIAARADLAMVGRCLGAGVSDVSIRGAGGYRCSGCLVAGHGQAAVLRLRRGYAAAL